MKITLICSTLKIGNKSFSLKPLIGCPFGSLFQIENGGNGPELARVMPSREEEGFDSLLWILLMNWFHLCGKNV